MRQNRRTRSPGVGIGTGRLQGKAKILLVPGQPRKVGATRPHLSPYC